MNSQQENTMTNDELFNLISTELKTKDWKKQPFNIFNACGIENHETAHSAFIANLLNPEGTHGCGNLFLIKFLDILKEKYQEIEIDKLSNDVWVETEHNETNVGRFDIWIISKTENAYMIIENKIYAEEGDEQLSKYLKFLNGQSTRHNEQRNGILLYLTLNGKAATKTDIKKNDSSGYYCISYFDTIKKWLTSCLEMKLDIRLMYWIQQYYELIDFITLNNTLKNKIISLKIKKEQIENILQKSITTTQENRFLKYLIYSFERIEKKDKK